MNFGTSKVEDKEALLKYISYGTQELKITDMSVQRAANGTPRVIFKMESTPNTNPKFEGVEGAKGKIGTVRSSYLRTDQQITRFNNQIHAIAKALNVSDEVKAIGDVPDLDTFVEKLRPLLVGKFAWFTVAAEQFIKADGSKGHSLLFPLFRFVGPTAADVEPFNINEKFHYKRVEETPSKEADTESTAEVGEESASF